MQWIEEHEEIFDDVEQKASENNPADHLFEMCGDIQTVIADNTGDGDQGDDQTQHLQDAVHLLLVRRNVEFQLAVRVLFMWFLNHITSWF